MSPDAVFQKTNDNPLIGGDISSCMPFGLGSMADNVSKASSDNEARHLFLDWPAIPEMSEQELTTRLLAMFYKPTAEEVISKQNQKAGRVSKTSALNFLIEENVRKNPNITEKELLSVLEAQKDCRNIISDIDEEYIFFVEPDNLEREKKAAISGLKDRLFRIKKVIAKTR